MRGLGTGRNAALKLFAILNLGKPASHVTQAKNTEQLVEISSEVTDSNMKIIPEEVYSISKKDREINSTGVSFNCIQNSRQ